MDGLLEKIKGGGTGDSLASREVSPSSDRSSWFKVYLLIGTTALLALLAGFLLRVGEFGYGALVLVIWTAAITIQTLILKSVRDISLASGLCTLGLVLPFWGAPLIYWGATALIVFLLLLATHDRGHKEQENMVKIRFSSAIRPVTSLLIVVWVIMITFLFSVSGANVFTQENVKRTVDFTVTPLMKGYVKDFSSDAKLGDVLKGIALQQINESPGSENLSASQKQLLAAQSAKEMGTLLREKANFNFQDELTVSANLHAFISQKSEAVMDPKAPMGILILAAVIFLLVKSIEFLLYIPLALISFMLYELLVAFSFIAVQSESRSKEVIILP